MDQVPATLNESIVSLAGLRVRCLPRPYFQTVGQQCVSLVGFEDDWRGSGIDLVEAGGILVCVGGNPARHQRFFIGDIPSLIVGLTEVCTPRFPTQFCYTSSLISKQNRCSTLQIPQARHAELEKMQEQLKCSGCQMPKPKLPYEKGPYLLYWIFCYAKCTLFRIAGKEWHSVSLLPAHEQFLFVLTRLMAKFRPGRFRVICSRDNIQLFRPDESIDIDSFLYIRDYCAICQIGSPFILRRSVFKYDGAKVVVPNGVATFQVLHIAGNAFDIACE